MIKVRLKVIIWKSECLINFIIAFQQSSAYPAGTIAYVVDEEALLVKVSKGWQYIAVSFEVIFLFGDFSLHKLISSSAHCYHSPRHM
jgi:hypothetical protein